MANRNPFNGKRFVQFSILVGRYLPKRMGYWLAGRFATLISSIQNLDINRSLRANQFIVRGQTNSHKELVQFSKKVLEHAGKCYYDLYHYIDKKDQLEEVVPLSRSMREFIKLSQEEGGYMIVAPHLSNFDLVVSRLIKGGFRGKVMSYSHPGSGYQLQNQIRKDYGLDLTPLGEPGVEQAMVNYLKNGGMVATGIDRPLATRKKRHYVTFFGKPSPLPLGYITTAITADVPIIPVTAIMEADGRYGFRYSEPIVMKKYQNKLDSIILNAERVLHEIEGFIRLAPEQWLMYYPVWPDILEQEL